MIAGCTVSYTGSFASLGGRCMTASGYFRWPGLGGGGGGQCMSCAPFPGSHVSCVACPQGPAGCGSASFGSAGGRSGTAAFGAPQGALQGAWGDARILDATLADVAAVLLGRADLQELTGAGLPSSVADQVWCFERQGSWTQPAPMHIYDAALADVASMPLQGAGLPRFTCPGLPLWPWRAALGCTCCQLCHGAAGLPLAWPDLASASSGGHPGALADAGGVRAGAAQQS